MKKIFTLLVLMCSLGAMAQEYTPLVREGVKWECVSEQIGWWEMDPVPFSIYFKGDTIVNDIEYKKCYIESDTAKFVAALMREDVAAKQVFVCYPESLFGDTYNARIHIHILDHFKSHQDLEKEYVLYDFNNIYNSAMIAEWKSVTNITNESFISVGDKQCKRTRVTNNSSANSNTQSAFFSLVEGVGFVSEIHNKFVYAKTNRCIYEGIMLDFLSYDQTTDGWEMITYFNRLVADDGTVLYESPNTYTPLVREGVKWNCVMRRVNWYHPELSFNHHYSIQIKGDTIINEVQYKKCYYIFEDKDEPSNVIPRAFLREDIENQQVFVLFNVDYKTEMGMYSLNYPEFGLLEEQMLYDFKNKKNTSPYWLMKYGSDWSIEVESLGMISLQNQVKEKYRLIYFRNDYHYLSVELVEGIGLCLSTQKEGETFAGDLLTPYIDFYLGGDNTFPVFLNLEDANGEIIYVAQEYNSIEGVTSDKDNATETARYDLYGRRLNRPTQGVNIIKMSDGSTRKEIVK